MQQTNCSVVAKYLGSVVLTFFDKYYFDRTSKLITFNLFFFPCDVEFHVTFIYIFTFYCFFFITVQSSLVNVNIVHHNLGNTIIFYVSYFYPQEKLTIFTMKITIALVITVFAAFVHSKGVYYLSLYILYLFLVQFPCPIYSVIHILLC